MQHLPPLNNQFYNKTKFKFYIKQPKIAIEIQNKGGRHPFAGNGRP